VWEGSLMGHEGPLRACVGTLGFILAKWELGLYVTSTMVSKFSKKEVTEECNKSNCFRIVESWELLASEK
jgi:hypothetical protein